MSFEITIEKTQNSRIGQFDPENIGFGKIFTDHMFLAHWDGTAWTNARIVPYGPLSLSPATSAIHYGQSIFEGMKAFADKQTGQPLLFRPRENWKRLNRSAERMVMPVVPEDLFMDGLKTLIQLDAEWVPKTEGGSLYIRPYMFATDDFIGVKPSETYTFAIFCCPVGPYYTKALKIKVEEEFSRAAPGGVGFTKCAGNYGAAMYPTLRAQQEGYDQVLWTDPLTHTLVEETGTTNMFAVFQNEIITPKLGNTLLAGITRDSVIQGLRELGHSVIERELSVTELKERLSAGELKEMFITGTAATLIRIQGFGHAGHYHEVLSQGDTTVSDGVKSWLDGIRHGETEDVFNWNERV
jgi:branched-chain amino acid aminotransferase